jgi:hypothetical protein
VTCAACLIATLSASSGQLHKPVLDAINYGRRVVEHRFLPQFAYGGLVAAAPIRKEIRLGDIRQQLTVADPDLWMRKARNAQRDSQIMAGLTVGV